MVVHLGPALADWVGFFREVGDRGLYSRGTGFPGGGAAAVAGLFRRVITAVARFDCGWGWCVFL